MIAGVTLPNVLALDSSSDFTVPKRSRKQREQREQRLQHVDNHMAQQYGINYNKLDAWQKLCEDFGINPAPQSINKCRKVCTDSAKLPAHNVVLIETGAQAEIHQHLRFRRGSSTPFHVFLQVLQVYHPRWKGVSAG